MIMQLIMMLAIPPKGKGGGEGSIIAAGGSIIPRPSQTSACAVAIAITFKAMLTIPMAINTPPIETGPPSISEGGIPERSSMSESSVKFPSWKADGGSEERTVPAATKAIPPKSMIIPTMILRIAIIVRPVGRDLGVACKLFTRIKLS
jgi:hypothetical protein